MERPTAGAGGRTHCGGELHNAPGGRAWEFVKGVKIQALTDIVAAYVSDATPPCCPLSSSDQYSELMIGLSLHNTVAVDKTQLVK